jgi:hypothetical protein
MIFLPFTKELLVNTTSGLPGNNRIDVFSADGKCVRNLVFSSREAQLYLTGLKPGIYIARMSDNQHNESLKIIIR